MDNKSDKTLLSRNLRKNSTPSEKRFWSVVRNKQWNGTKWNRQYPIVYEKILGKEHFFIADFYCATHKLIVELDGQIHDTQQEYDEARTLILRSLGYKLMRFRNEETENMQSLLEKLAKFLTS